MEKTFINSSSRAKSLHSRYLHYLQISLSRGIAALGLIILNLTITNLAGPDSLGRLIVLISIAAGFGVATRFGLDLLTIRVIGSASPESDRFICSYFWAALTAIAFSATICIVLAQVSADLILRTTGTTIKEINEASILFLPLATASFLGASFRAIGHPAKSQLMDIGGFSLLISLGFIIHHYSNTKYPYTPYLFATFAFTTITFWLIKKEFIKPDIKLRNGLQEIFTQRRSIIMLYAFSLLQFCSQWATTIISSTTLTSTEVASLTVAIRYAMALFVLQGTIGGIMAPKYAKLFKNNNYNEIVRIEKKIKTTMLAITSLPAIVLLTSPSIFLSPFGITGEGAEQALRILIISQIINVGAGCSAFMLIASGRENLSLKIGCFSVFIGISITLVGVKTWGLTGVALGQASLIVAPSMLSLLAIQHILRNSKTTSLNLLG